MRPHPSVCGIRVLRAGPPARHSDARNTRMGAACSLGGRADRGRRDRRGGPGGAGGRDGAGPGRARRRGRRQGGLPARQVLRRRADDARRCASSSASGSTRARSTDWQVVDGAVLRSPSGREVRVPLPAGPGTYAAVAPRLQLDDALVDVAVEGRRHRRCRATASTARSTTAATTSCVGVEGHAPIAARYVVAADGMWSPVRKALGLGPEPGYLGEWHAFRQYVARRRRRRPPTTCSSGSTPTSCPATRGRSRCPAAGPTSASACCATAPGASRT